MSFIDHNGEVEYPYSFKTVFDALMEAIPNISGIDLDGADEISGRVTLKAGMSLASWGENINVQLTKINNTSTKMQILSTPKTGVMFGGAMDLGKNRENINKIINAVSKVLSTKSPEVEITPSSNVSTADELLKLKQLKEEGILSEKEFDEQKQKVLSGNPVEITTQKASSPSTSAPIHIEGDNSSNSSTLAIVAIIVFVIIFLCTLL